VFYRTLIFLITVILLEGCGTLKTLSPAGNHVDISLRGMKSRCETIPRIYSGTCFEVCKLYGEPSYTANSGLAIGGLPLFIFDIPLSLIMDTLVLPYTTIRQFKDGNIFVN
jgi:uncharacterized protein YceK